MYRLNLKCKLITPMFMVGADSNTPELRASEFKGMIRWWWRAIRSFDDINKLSKEEAYIFGGSGDGEGKSKIKIRVLYNLDCEKVGQNLRNDYGLEWVFDRRKGTLVGRHAGIAYLLYSVLSSRQRSFLKDGFEFEILLESFDKTAFDNAVASLWAAIYLGGFGTRARRGGGNVSVENAEGDSTGRLLWRLDKSNPSEIAQWLIDNLTEASNIINGAPKPQNFASSYSNLSFSRFIISNKSYRSAMDALSEVGGIYKTFRYTLYETFRYTRRKDIFNVGAFGLPVVYRGGKVLKSVSYNRRSSPIIIKVLTSSGKFYWFVLRLSGEFLPTREVLRFGDKTQKPDYKIIDEFWKGLKSAGNECILMSPQVLERVKGKIISSLNPSRIWLFGSRARGDAHRNSDIDLAVETDLSIDELGITTPWDIVPFKKTDDELKSSIEREGVLIYERKG